MLSTLTSVNYGTATSRCRLRRRCSICSITSCVTAIVSKDELIDSVWHGRAVTDSLTTRINAVRVAF